MTLTEAQLNMYVVIGLYGTTTNEKDVTAAIDELVRAAKEEAWDEGYGAKMCGNPYYKAPR